MTDNYGSVVNLLVYAAARDWDASAIPADPDAQLAGLLVASEYLDNYFRNSFSGYKTGQRAQIREWPRTGAYASAGTAQTPIYGSQYFGNYYTIADDEIPIEIENATYEVAKRQYANPNALYTDFIKNKSYKSASVYGAVSVVYNGANSASDAQLIIPIVGAILEPILTGNGNTSSLSGGSQRA